MRRQSWLALALLAGCASASSPPFAPDAVPNDTIVVPAPSSSGWTPVATSSARPTPARPPRPSSLEGCVAELRAAPLGPPSVDSELYLRALGDEQRSQLADARKAYLKLIQDFPQSLYIPPAYLAFGEMFMLDAVADPSKWELARMAYLKVLEYPPEKTPVSAYARLRVSESFLRTGNADRALDMARRSAMVTDDRLPCIGEIHRAAIALAVEAYATSGRPERAQTFFKTFVTTVDELDQAMIDLGKRYAATDRRPVCTLLASGVSPSVKQALDPACSP